jgi:cytochrome c oxidase subunit IV
MAHDAKQAGEHAAHAHPTGATYLKIFVILTLITVVEVWAYYIPALVASPLFNPTLIAMSAAKFVMVVMFYMHLKFDHKLFRVLFTGPMIIAGATITALLFLFGQFKL